MKYLLTFCYFSDMFFNGCVLPEIPYVKTSIINISKEKKENIFTTVDSKLDSDYNVECIFAFGLSVTKGILFKKLIKVTEHVQQR